MWTEVVLSSGQTGFIAVVLGDGEGLTFSNCLAQTRTPPGFYVLLCARTLQLSSCEYDRQVG